MIYLTSRYSFPTVGEFRSYKEPERELEKAAELDQAKAEAGQRGYEEGLAKGRSEAEQEARGAFETARREGFEAGAVDGRERASRAAEAIEQGLEEIHRERERLAAEAESFCVDLALAIVSRLVEIDSVRADFVSRAVANALGALAPEEAEAIYLNPADREILGKKLKRKRLPIMDDAELAPGQVRVDAGRLMVQSAIDEAFAQLKTAVLETRTRKKNSRKR